jgi:hypothetical protein
VPDLPDTPDDRPGDESLDEDITDGDTPESGVPGPRRIRWGWLLLAVVVGAVSLLAATIQVGTCSDVGCTRVPALGAGAWMVGVAGTGFVVYAIRRGLRGR